MHSGIVYWVSNLILSFFWMVTANIIFDSRMAKWKTVILETIIHFAWWYLSEDVFTVFASIRVVLEVAALIIIFCIFHTDRFFFKVITALLTFASVAISELLLAMVLPWDMVMSGELFVRHGVSVYTIYLFINLIMLTVIVFVLTSHKKTYQEILSTKQRLLFLLFPLSQVAAISGWSYAFRSTEGFLNPLQTLIIVVLDVIADMALFVLLRMTADNTELRIRNELLEEQIGTQRSYYADLTSAFADIRKMRHDIDNHLFTIKALIADGKTSQAEEYAAEVAAKEKDLRFSECRNTILASYLNKKAADIRDQGIKLESSVNIPSGLKIFDPDLICIFGNILDNAIEACQGIDDASICLKAVYREPYLTIHCDDPAAVYEDRRKRIPQLERGLGLNILSDLASSYDGRLDIQELNGRFHIDITLKNIKKEGR